MQAKHICVIIATIVCIAGSAQTIYNVVGTYNNWPTTWNLIPSLTYDAADLNSNTHLDFIGNDSAPVGFYNWNSSYIFFRMRVRGAVTPSDYRDSLFVLIDVVGFRYDKTIRDLRSGEGIGPDFGFAWDSKETGHGLEMVALDTVGQGLWQNTKMDDWDGSSGQKLYNDINGGNRTTDGYVRIVSDVGNIGDQKTSFIDFAVSLSYLASYVTNGAGNPLLNPVSQTWKVTFASIANANDHNLLDTDIAGGANPSSSVSQGWSAPFTVIPEPVMPSWILGAIALVAILPNLKKWVNNSRTNRN